MFPARRLGRVLALVSATVPMMVGGQPAVPTIALRLLDQVRISGGIEYTYSATLTNPGPPLAGATASAATLPPYTTVSRALLFGPVSTKGKVPSTNAVTIRYLRSSPFLPSSIT